MRIGSGDLIPEGPNVIMERRQVSAGPLPLTLWKPDPKVRRSKSRSPHGEVRLPDRAKPTRSFDGMARGIRESVQHFASWGRSSAGRASRSQREGRRFEPARLHQFRRRRVPIGCAPSFVSGGFRRFPEDSGHLGTEIPSGGRSGRVRSIIRAGNE